MAKIIGISNQIISIGTDEGGIEEIRAGDINFVPHIGDEVEIFKTEQKMIVSKVESKNSGIPEGGIHINMQNTQTQEMKSATIVAVHGKVVKKVVYCVLAILLGAFGIHKFYAGKSGAGIAYLLFFWTGVPFVLAIVDFIIGLTKAADDNGNIIV